MRLTYAPLITCNTCGTAMHDHGRNREAHADRCHSSFYPAGFSYPTESALIAAGWTRDDFTSWPYPSDAAPIAA